MLVSTVLDKLAGEVLESLAVVGPRILAAELVTG